MGPLLITIFVATGWVATLSKVAQAEPRNSETLEIAKCIEKYHPAEAELYYRMANDRALDVEYEAQTEICLVNGTTKVNCIHINQYDDRVESCF